MVLEGGAQLGDVPASDIARFIDGVVRTVGKAAGHAIGREVKRTGRWQNVVAAASQLRLVEIRSGSVEFVFAPAPQEVGLHTLGLNVESLSQRALVIAAAAAGDQAATYRDVARAWLDTADSVGVGDRYARIRVFADQIETAVIDAPALDRLRAVTGRGMRSMPATLQGRLYEANFDARTATLRTPAAEVVQVQYGEEQADDIYRVLRGPANLRGDVTYDPGTNKAVRVRVSRIESSSQLLFEEFWQEKPLARVIAEQGLSPIRNSGALVIPGLDPEDWRALREGLEA